MRIATTTGDMEILRHDHIGKVKALAEAGFKYIDLSFYNTNFSDPVMSENWVDYVNKLKETADTLGLKFIQCHLGNAHPIHDADFDSNVKCILREIEVCGILGIENAVLHSVTADGWDKEKFFAENRKFYNLFLPTAEKSGVRILIENTTKKHCGNSYFFTFGHEMNDFIDYMGSDYIGACWDTGHANIDGHNYDDIVALGKNLKAVHINDNRGRCDEHIAPFMGTLNMDEIMCALIDNGFKGYFTFESSDAIKKSRHWLQTRVTFEKSKILENPNVDMYKAMVKFIYEIGKATLKAYNIFEE